MQHQRAGARRLAPTPPVVGRFDGTIMVGTNEPGKVLAASDYPLTIAGHAVRYYVSTDGAAQTLSLRLSSRLVVDIQIPVAAHLTRAQAVMIGNALDIRDPSHHSSG